MNKVKFEPLQRNAAIEPYENQVVCELVRIKSDFTFVSPFQAVDSPKERE